MHATIELLCMKCLNVGTIKPFRMYEIETLIFQPSQSKPSFQEVYVFGLWWIDELSKDSKADNPDFLDILTQRWFKISAVHSKIYILT